MATNSPPSQAENQPQAQLGAAFLEGIPELALDEPKANELTSGRHTYSGIAIQVKKAKRPLQLLNPAAPPQYGSGWDNIERLPASGGSPVLKLFSISF